MYRPFKDFRVTYADRSTKVISMPCKSMVYAVLRRLKIMGSVFGHPHVRHVKVEEIVDE